MPEIDMYCTSTCPFCHRAEKLLRSKGVKINKINVENNHGKLREMLKRSKRNTVPQIFIDGKHIGGFDDLSELDIDDKLEPLLGIK